MEQLGDSGRTDLFGSPLEYAVRTLIVLDATAPRQFDLSQIVWLNYVLVHSADFDGPASLHPSLAPRSGELSVSVQNTESGIQMLRRLHLIEVCASDRGIEYRRSDYTHPFVEMFSTPYAVEMKNRAQWVAREIKGSDSHIQNVLDLISKEGLVVVQRSMERLANG